MANLKVLMAGQLATVCLVLAVLDLAGEFANAEPLQHVAVLLMCAIGFLMSLTVIEGA